MHTALLLAGILLSGVTAWSPRMDRYLHSGAQTQNTGERLYSYSTKVAYVTYDPGVHFADGG